MTAEEAFNYSMNAYPSLYTAATVREARNQVFDHIFNVIGNGYRDHDEFVEGHLWQPNIAEMTRTFPAKYIGTAPLFTGYTAMETRRKMAVPIDIPGIDSSLFDMPDMNSSLHGLYTEAEKEFHPDVKKWTQSNRFHGEHAPYPNFKPRYSLLYHVKLDELDDSWLHAGIEFYGHCREYFNSPLCEGYSGAWPSDPKKQARLVGDYEKAIARSTVGIDDQAEQWAAISKAYETPYEGDVPLFIQARWSKEKDRIEAFIESTIAMLEENLAKRHNAAPTL